MVQMHIGWEERRNRLRNKRGLGTGSSCEVRSSYDRADVMALKVVRDPEGLGRSL